MTARYTALLDTSVVIDLEQVDEALLSKALGAPMSDAVPFDADAARSYGVVAALVIAGGRKPRKRLADLLIAATALAHGLPLVTRNPDDFAGLERIVKIVSV